MKRSGRRWDRVLVGVLVWGVCVLLAGGHLYSPDEEILYRLTESIAARGELSIEPLLGFATREGRDGKQYPQYPPLQAVLATPLYGLARLTRPLVSDETILRATWETVQYHDQSADAYWNRFWVVMGFNPLVTALTAVLVWGMAWRLSGRDRKAAWFVALSYGLSTLALPHSRTFFTEPLAAFWLMAALAALLAWADAREAKAGDLIRGGGADGSDGEPDGLESSRAPADPTVEADPMEPVTPAVPAGPMASSASAVSSGWIRWPLLAGLAAAAGVWTRVDFPLFLPGLSLGVLLLSLPAGFSRGGSAGCFSGAALKGISWRCLLAFAVPVGLSLVGWFLFNRWRFGGVVATGYEDQEEGVRFATPFLIGLHGFLCSPGKGLFFFSPPLLIALFGVRGLAWRRSVSMLSGRAVWALAWAVSGGLFFVFMCKWQNWAGGWCWGPRHIFQIHALLILGLAPLLVPPRRTLVKVAAIVAFVAGLGVQLFGSSQSFIDFYQEFFVFTARHQPNFHALYSLQEEAVMPLNYTIQANTSEGPAPIPAQLLPAPINDSIYVPQNTQWYGYPILLRMGRHDLFWVHLVDE